jgi:hypothetical protein
MSVIRFCIPTAYCPIFVWPEAAPAGSNLPNNSYYSVTINNSQVFLTYVPLNNTTVADVSNLFVYSYQQFIDAINVALNADFIAAGGGATAPPYLIYDAPTGLISIVAQKAYANQTNYKIYFNNPLYTFFDNWKVQRNGVGTALGKDVQIFVQNNGNNDYTGHPPNYAVGTADDSYIMTQEYCALFNWSTVRSIVFTTNTIPVASESINVQQAGLDSTGSNYRKIITDFEPVIQSGISNNTLRSYLQYQPSGEYRMIGLESNQPLYTTDIAIYFETSDQKLYQLYINDGEYISIKMLFRKKRSLGGFK